MKKIKKIILALCFPILFIGVSCSKEMSSENAINSDELHFSFKTPDWERKIDCSLLDLYPEIVNDTTLRVSATSASTKESFLLTYPKDSSQMVRPRTYKKYKIMEYGYNEEPFQFSQVLPLDEISLGNSSKTLISKAGFSATENNQVTEIKYIRSETQCAVFKIKCTYEMKTYLQSTPDVIKPVSGTYAFIIRTSKL